jgi:hypothetical protein
MVQQVSSPLSPPQQHHFDGNHRIVQSLDLKQEILIVHRSNILRRECPVKITSTCRRDRLTESRKRSAPKNPYSYV